MVPEAGLEPARPLRQRILNPSCLPISPLWHGEQDYSNARAKVNRKWTTSRIFKIVGTGGANLLTGEVPADRLPCVASIYTDLCYERQRFRLPAT